MNIEGITTHRAIMRHASLFSGIGGPEVAAAMLGWDNVFHCEINEFGRKVLEYWFPESDSYEDITKTNFTKYRGRVDVLTGGFPCQPFSYAGKRKGQADDRYLWPEMLRVIDEVRPTWVIGENVAGITTMVESCQVTDMGSEATLFEASGGIHRYTAEFAFTIERVCSDLESKGYSVQPMLIPACAVGAPHRRDRVFIIARIIADPDCGNDLREPREYESKSSEERISERDKIRKSGEPDNVRFKVQELIENSMCDGCQFGQEKEQRNQRNIGDAGPGDSERICGEKRVNPSDSISKGLERSHKSGCCEGGQRMHLWRDFAGCGGTVDLRPENRWKAFPSVPPVHRGNDGLPFDVDNLTIPFGKWRTESLKAYGNAIVPQVMYRIFQCIDQVEHGNKMNSNMDKFRRAATCE